MTPAQKDRFFQIYYGCRYQAHVAETLMRRAARVEKINLWLLLVSLFVSLAAGGASFLRNLPATPVWALFSALSTVLSVYSLVMAYGEKQYAHHDRATKFLALALKVENYSSFAVHLPQTTADHIDEKAVELHAEYSRLIESVGREHREYSNKHDAEVREAVTRQLIAEHKANPTRYIDPILP